MATTDGIVLSTTPETSVTVTAPDELEPDLFVLVEPISLYVSPSLVSPCDNILSMVDFPFLLLLFATANIPIIHETPTRTVTAATAITTGSLFFFFLLPLFPLF